ncbi:GNAT family N-acetyltransferase [Arthrobacter bambusae]|uniref:GNAT superfamily N-acetyltransferase n=1 Tax=Arthrobacter bambusae TaxID=1338426 RepID=A0AAW8DMU3_9MICC|nr:GNAT family N-acetyltransferase [Arthrobacter bambusae]MDP9907687.1 GNAT superfamily N-acetyltransferase [Arthrobacter bambusae]MDQ0131651.1 GNAT superfamily N-acetyltransferase [Arthrobacter bambusae]MDQ0183063.1 GNAT superfamily N-acetyltransferase [Arthrobacter bambusae]
MIRTARADELEQLRGIEFAAGEIFRSCGMDAIADDEPLTVTEMALYQARGGALVFADTSDVPVAYLLIEHLDGNAHVEQLSVHPSHARQGLGSELLDVAEKWAQAQGLEWLTLTTFRDVPWNAPYYRRLGFEELGPELLDDGLRGILECEGLVGLSRWPRIAMRRRVRPIRGQEDSVSLY